MSSGPSSTLALRAAANAHARAGRLPEALDCIRRAVALAPAEVISHLQLGQLLLAANRRREALAAAEQAARLNPERADWCDAIGTLFTYCEEPLRALPFFERASLQAPDNETYLYNLATAQRMLGKFASAEALLNRVLARHPQHAAAHHLRSDLRTWTPSDNHVADMSRLLQTGIVGSKDRILLCFALAKELDDIGSHDRAFEALRQGCEQQRRLFNYDVQDDVTTIDRIIQRSDAATIKAGRGYESGECLFVMGLPRSGTTLVEQILASHPDVHGAGELQAFPTETIKAVQQVAGRAVNKHEFVEYSLRVDAAALGRAYVNATRPQTGHTPFFVDKQPNNFLYAGLIRRSLPRARLIALTRDPMDSCFAMYRALFPGTYPFSYTLSELATYYGAWHRLMTHWRDVLGDALLLVRYEELVSSPEAAVRRMLSHCGLSWDSACLAFHERSRAVTTASAAQVRRPVYTSSVGKWRHYEEHLKPLRSALQALEPQGGWGL